MAAAKDEAGQMAGGMAATIEAVREVERSAGLATPDATGHRRHLWTGRTAIATDLLCRPGKRWGAQHFWPRYVRLIASGGRIERLLPHKLNILPTGVTADLLYFKTQIRGFYCERPLTFKLSRPGNANSARTVANEAVMRTDLRETDRIRVPRLHAHGAVGDGHYIVEALIDDGDASRGRRLPVDTGAAMFAFYRDNRFSIEPLASIIDPGAELAALASNAKAYGFSVPDGAIAFVQQEILGRPDSGSDAMRSLLHGDLTPTNLMPVNGRLYLLDWEHACTGMTFSDIARLCTVDEAVERDFCDAADAWVASNAHGAMPAAHQLLLGAIAGINRRIARGDQGEAADRSAESRRVYRLKAEPFMALIARLLHRAATGHSRGGSPAA
jgi:hypothetical protein